MNFAADFLRSSRFSASCNRLIARFKARRGQRGWALVSVLWVTSLLALLAAASQTLTVTSYRAETKMLEQARLDAAFNAAIVRTVMGVTDPDPQARWRVDAVPQTFAFDGYDLKVAVQDELGRIDLNAADVSVFRQLLMTAGGLSMEDAETLSDRMADWRSAPSTDLSRLHGASDADYAAAGLAWHPRHGPFQTVDEAKLVLGMTPQIFARIRGALTVYTRTPLVDPNVASRTTLLAYFANDAEKVDGILQQRTESSPAAHTLNPAMPVGGRAFSVDVETSLGARKIKRSAVIELTGDSARPYFVLAWR